MNIADIQSTVRNHPQVQELIKYLETPKAKIQAKGIVGSARSFIFSSVFSQLNKHHLYILSDNEEANYFENDLENLIDKKRILFYPSPYKRHRMLVNYDNSLIQQRTEVLNRLKEPLSKPHIIITYPEALAETVVSAQHIQDNTFNIKLKDSLDIDFIIDFLVEYGFERVDFVYEPGTFSIRGGIVDVFSYASEKPFRVELFGDEVESIKQFDPETQLSEKRLQRVTVIPNMESSKQGQKRISFLDFLPTDIVVWADSFENLENSLQDVVDRANNLSQQVVEELPYHPASVLDDMKQLMKNIASKSTVEEANRSFFKSHPKYQFHQQPQTVFNKKFDLLADKLDENRNAGYSTFIFSESTKQLERIYAILEDIERKPDFIPIYKSLHKGFVDDDLKIACYTEQEIFNRFKNFKSKTTYNQDKAITLKELYQLQPGDYVVHIDHGIGKFSGLEKLEVHGRKQEAVRLEYKSGDLLYVNIHSLHKISRFVGQEGKEPSVHKLGSAAWANLKQKTKNKVKDIARDLIKLYAARRTQKGFAFAPDSYLQTELEASFIYEDTPDQAKTTAEVKADMEKPHPMDRLVCGDVGFGKTEIAIRAAFKAATDGKQVAILVPTTVLALQHYKTFHARLQDFPVEVDYVNRFKSAKQVKETLKRLSEGKVDIIIGTHRLLGKDIKFSDLGLLIIDEEQKFGVAAKEKLKSFKLNVDTLTLTATPIPRTLSFSLMGARDLSTINTPPPNRQSIDTRLHVFNDHILAEALNYEVARRGQVFYIHNRIKDIYHHAEKIESLCPGVKVGVAHGQMEGKQLEEIMAAFIEGFYDVLVSTSIVESGLDISNANTMIINNAQNFGLSDMYQMRGRVGRSNKKAFCYLFTPPVHTLTTVARKRLSALEQHSDLGSGFNIAMRDLDIRGAGNILGGEQSGFIAEIGIEMYQKILDEAVQELKDSEFKNLFEGIEAPKKIRDTQIDSDLEMMLPDKYVSNINERMNLYRELNKVSNEDEIESFKASLKDRFGTIPQPTLELFDMLRLKWKGQEMGVEKFILKANKMRIQLPDSTEEDFYQSDDFGRFLSFVQMNPRKVNLEQKNGAVQLTFTKINSVQAALNILQQIQETKIRS